MAALGDPADLMLELRQVAPREWELVYPPAYVELRPELDGATELMEAGDLSGSETALRRLLAEAPWNLDAHHYLAEILQARGLSGEALEHWSRAVQIGRGVYPRAFDPGTDGILWSRQSNRGFLRSLRGLGLALAARGRRDEALAALRELVLLDPNDPLDVRAAALCMALDLDRPEEALELAQTWEEGEPAEVSYGRALALFGMSEQGKAEHALRLAISAAPQFASELIQAARARGHGSDHHWVGRWNKYPGAWDWLKRGKSVMAPGRHQ
jgi:tetratricopeptide (TPR) repeat protein